MTTISQIGVIATELTGSTLLEIEQYGESKQITAELAKSFFTRLADVTNGTAAAGAIPLVAGTDTSRTVARVQPTNSDVVITAGATPVDPVSIGLNGTTLKYWEETSTGTALLDTVTWQPKTQGIAVISAPTRINLNYATSTLRLSDGIIFAGRNNGGSLTASAAHPVAIAIGESNYAAEGLAIGKTNTAVCSDFQGTSAVAIGRDCSAYGAYRDAIAIGSNVKVNDGDNGSYGGTGIGRNIIMTGNTSTVINSAFENDFGTSGISKFGQFHIRSVPITRGTSGATIGSLTPAGFIQASSTTSGETHVVNSYPEFVASIDLFVRVKNYAGGADKVSGVVRVEAFKQLTGSGTQMYFKPCVLLGGAANLLNYFDFKMDVVSNQLCVFWKLLSVYPSADTTDIMAFSGNVKVIPNL